MTLRILPYGDRAVLVEVADLDRAVALYRALDADRAVGVEDLVPAARTVLVVIEPRILTVEAANRWIRQAAESAAERRAPDHVAVHRIGVRYDGDDLETLATYLGTAPAALIEQHTGQDWTVAFGGFAPGFAYLAPTTEWPDVPRLSSPRTAVPSGSVAVAGGFSGIYPRPSPGGWQLLGRTSAVLWDSARTPPALLQPGSIVRFEPVP